MKNTPLSARLSLFLKGFALGTANVIPGVSGGTIALITGIFERLINSLKSFNISALQLLLKGKIKEFIAYTDLAFLTNLALGIVVAVISLARVFEFLFENYPIYIWSYFFGLILASVYYVGRTITKWDSSVWISLFIGITIAVIITFLDPAQQNENTVYLMMCGVLGICSMILPGLSGSFILILMGNYELIVIDAINNFRLDILIPVGIGAVAGLMFFSRLLSWLLNRFNNQTIALLTGFIFGSLGILWPWKNALFLKDTLGELILKHGEPIIYNYERVLPEFSNSSTWIAVVIMGLGILSIMAIEYLSKE